MSSENDLDLDVATTASVIGHLWTGPSSNQAKEVAAVPRAQGQAYLRLLVDTLIKEDEANAVVSTTKAFVRVSYQCGTHHWGPFTVVTESPDEESQRDLERVLHLKSRRHYPYSRVHGTIAAAQKILAAVPSKNLETPVE